MIEDFNLLATTMRGTERDASAELSFLLQNVGDLEPKVGKTGISGLIAIRTTLDPLEVIKRFRKLLLEHPYEFRYTLRIIPIVKVVPTDLQGICCAVAQLSSGIGENETFRITVEKRFSQLSSKAIVESSAGVIRRKVNLSNPDKVVLIEVVGRSTGLSIIKPSDVLSVLKEKAL
jgi:tRNA acetyltransferase TAN1